MLALSAAEMNPLAPLHIAIAILAAVAALDAAINLVERFRRRNTLPPSPHIAPAPGRRKPPSKA
jgi:hypothetical protein